MTRIVVDGWSADEFRGQYDFLLVALGFEKRARYVAEELDLKAKMKIAGGFRDRQVHSYGANKKWLKKNGFTVVEETDDKFGEWVTTIVEDAVEKCESEEVKVCIDISSFSGIRVASIVDALRQGVQEKDFVVDFVYSLAKFSRPGDEMSQNRHAGPVLPEFAGWTPEPECPPTAIVGLGYEVGKALGAVEHIQASTVWTFIPESPIGEYLLAVKKANEFFLETISMENVLSYRVDRPFDTFIRLESLIHRLVGRENPVLLPFGPKIFGLCALLVACIYPTIGVWRVSTGSEGDAVNRFPSGKVFGLRVRFSKDE